MRAAQPAAQDRAEFDLEVVSERRAGRPTSEETGRLNENILQAAFRVFVREGFGGASIEQIAQESRTTRRSVLNRFRDKEALLIAIVEMRMRRLEVRLRPSEAVLATKPLEAIKEACRLMLEVAVDPEGIDFYRLCLAHAGKFPEITVATTRWNDRWLADLQALIERAQRAGAFEGRDPALLATGLIGAFISNPVNRAALGDTQFRDPAPLRRYFNGMWGFIQDLV
jgi:AcrR family transcriptional regulator